MTHWGRDCTDKGRARYKFRVLYDAYSVFNIPRGVPGTRVNPYTCEQANSICIRMRVDVEIFESGKKSCGFKNIRTRVDGAKKASEPSDDGNENVT